MRTLKIGDFELVESGPTPVLAAQMKNIDVECCECRSKRFLSVEAQSFDWREIQELRDFCDEWLRERGRA